MIKITEMTKSDLKQAIALWDSIPELGFSKTFDTEIRLARFLSKNEGFSCVAKEGGRTVGALLCGHDGRRGFFYHIGVNPEFRGRNIATKMVEFSFSRLKDDDIDTCFLFTNHSNEGAQAFWGRMGFEYASHVMYQSRAI